MGGRGYVNMEEIMEELIWGRGKQKDPLHFFSISAPSEPKGVSCFLPPYCFPHIFPHVFPPHIFSAYGAYYYYYYFLF
jgi:hypothetical protein